MDLTKYSLGMKLVAVGVAVLIAAYFGMDVSAWVNSMLGSATTPVLP